MLLKSAFLAISVKIGAQDSTSTDYALKFGEDNIYVSIPNSADYYNDNFTIEAWVYPTDFSANAYENPIVSAQFRDGNER